MLDRQNIGNTIVSPKAFAENTYIHDAFREFRAAGKPVRVEPDGYRPFWAVTKHAHIMDASRRNDVFSSHRRMTLMNKVQEASTVEAAGKYGRVLRSLINMDEPDHTAYRKVTQEWFSVSSVRKLQPMLQDLANEFCDKLETDAEGAGSIDFATEIATWYPLRVIMSILGVPREDLPLMHQLTKLLAAPQDPDFGGQAGMGERPFDSIPMFTEYFIKMMENRRRQPRDDLASVIANGKIDGQPLGELETVSYYITMAVAGHDTTAAAIAGGMRAFAEHPAQWRNLKQRPDLIPSAVEEIVRWVSPVKHFMRTALCDTDLGGVTVPAGEAVTMYYLSGNRDEDIFVDPFSFQIDRRPNRHLGFGFGPHMCLGMMLSRLEITTLFTELLKRVESVELNGPVQAVEANFLSGFKTMPIGYRLAA